MEYLEEKDEAGLASATEALGSARELQSRVMRKAEEARGLGSRVEREAPAPRQAAGPLRSALSNLGSWGSRRRGASLARASSLNRYETPPLRADRSSGRC